MEEPTRVLAFVLAGGEGRRLAPLTRHVAKPAIPFHYGHRLIDFALSNLRNSGIRAIHVLMQYQSHSVLRHLMAAWRCGPAGPDGFINPATGGLGGMPVFAGTADAVYRNRQEIIDFRPDVVAIFSADHIYRMDVRQMIDFHLASGADVTVSAVPVPLAEATSFGVLETDDDSRIRRFAEKPRQPQPMSRRPDHAFASMGNYLFSPRVLLEALEATHAAGGTDFGGDLLPALVTSHRLMAYDFTCNRIPGLPAGCDPHYWRDVGTIDAYFAAHMDTIAPPGATARFEIMARAWPIQGADSVFDPSRQEGTFGCYQSAIAGTARVEGSILRRGAFVGEGAVVSNCILGEDVDIGAGCRLRNVIVEADNQVPPGFEVGFDPARDHEWLPVSEGGVVVIPRGFFATTLLARTISGLAGSSIAPTVVPVARPAASTARIHAPGRPAGSKATAPGKTTATVTPMLPGLTSAVSLAPRRRESGDVEAQSATKAARA